MPIFIDIVVVVVAIAVADFADATSAVFEAATYPRGLNYLQWYPD